jgi:hypothetical protein
MNDGRSGWPEEARHCLRLGAMNDKRIVEEAQESFDVVVLQANLAAAASKGLASWAGLRRPFWIDPVAYAFAASPSYLMSESRKTDATGQPQVDFKSTFRKLAEHYGAPFDRVIAEVRSLVPGDFDPSDDRDVTERVLRWQQEVLQTGEDTKYGLPATLEPVLLTVPYFPLRGPWGQSEPDWLAVNLRLIDAAVGMRPGHRLAAGLLVEGDIFDDARFDGVLDAYLSRAVEHLWLWVSANDEVEMTPTRAQRLVDVVDQVVARGKKVHLAFGGSFSTFLLGRGASSVGHGVGYWESKGWEPIAGGGRPTLRYFFPPLRQRLAFLDADAVLDVEDVHDFHSTICGCEICREVLDGDLRNFGLYGQVEVRARQDRWGNRIEYDVPAPESLRRSKLHYLRAKGIEARLALDRRVDLSAVLLQDAETHGSQQVVSVQHLRRWADALDR